MTAVLDPPTEESTDLTSQRWEVETSTPVAITGEVPLGDADFVLMSHAEQALGDFPIAMSQPSELFFQLRDYARTELGMISVVGGILFNQGIPVHSYGDSRFAWGDTGFPTLRALLVPYVQESSGIYRMEQRRIVEELIEQFPVPIFGSPPNAWTALSQVASSSSCVAFAGYAAWIDQPVLAFHRLLHQGDWEIRFAADGVPEYLPPAWIDPNRAPRRNMMHHNPFPQRT